MKSESKKIFKEKVKYLELLTDGSNEHSSRGSILVIGNAYGIMPYQEPLAFQLGGIGYKPYWFAFRGQEGIPGYYSFETGIEDIQTVTEYLKEKNELPLYILAHCSGSLLTLEYMVKNQDNPFEKLMIYGFLYNMNRRRKIAERKFEESKVKYKLSENDWNYKPLNALSKIQIPVLFCHAKDESNLGRGTKEEMELALSHTKNSRIRWFDEGYDNNFDMIPHYIRCYKEFLESNQ